MTEIFRSKDGMNDFSRLANILDTYVRPHAWVMVAVVLWHMIESGLAILRPLLMTPVLDVVFAGSRVATDASTAPPSGLLDLNEIGVRVSGFLQLEPGTDPFSIVITVCACFITISLFKAAGSFLVQLMAIRVRFQAHRALELSVFAHLLSFPIKFFATQKTGELASRMDIDTGIMTRLIDPMMKTLVMSPLLIVMYGLILIQTDILLAGAVLAAGIAHFGVTRAVQKPIRRDTKKQYTVLADLMAQLQETVMAIRVAKSFCAEEFERRRLEKTGARATVAQTKAFFFRNLQTPVRAVVDTLVQAGVLLLATYQVLNGDLTPQGFLLFLYISTATLGPISNLAATFSQFPTILASTDRIYELLAIKASVADGSMIAGKFSDAIRIECLTYSYGDRNVLKGVDLEFRKGEMVALVGPSGAGKSTLADLLVRFDDPVEGRITLDGQDIREFTQKSYRGLFRMVPQESLLFNDTVRSNIEYSRTGISERDLIRAARIANAEEFISELPDGYDTMVGDRGIRLSGGQRQRIALARAIVDHPEILILDEATSSLDSESERQVQTAIDQVLKSVTAVVIAHRLSTVLNADKIVVMEKGTILDMGSHAELYQRCSLYKRLCDLQFDGSLLKERDVEEPAPRNTDWRNQTAGA